MVANQGGQRGTFSVLLRVDQQAIDALPITLEPGEQGQALFFISQEREGTYQIEVEGLQGVLGVARPLEPADIRFTSLRVAPKEVAPGEPVTVALQIQNLGDLAGKVDLEVLINGVLTEIRPVRIPGGITASLSFPLARELPGGYEVSIGGLSDEFMVVKVLTPATFTVSNLSVFPTQGQPGQPVRVSVLVRNTGEQSGDFTVTLLVNGQVEQEQTVNVEGLGALPVTFDVTRTEAGIYEVEIAGERVTYTVEGVIAPVPTPPATTTPAPTPSAAATQTPSPSSAAGGPPIGLIIGIAVVVLAVAGAAVYFLTLRRRGVAA